MASHRVCEIDVVVCDLEDNLIERHEWELFINTQDCIKSLQVDTSGLEAHRTFDEVHLARRPWLAAHSS